MPSNKVDDRRAVDSDDVRVVVGFGCNQAFIFSLFYLGMNRTLGSEPYVFERADLFGVLLCMVLALLVVRNTSPRARDALLSTPLLWCFATLIVVASLASELLEVSAASVVLESVLVGFSSGIMMVAWGRAFDAHGVGSSLRDIFVSFAFAALVCLVVSAIPIDEVQLLLDFLPFGSAFMLYQLRRPKKDGKGAPGEESSSRDDKGKAAPAPLRIADLVATKEQREQALRISRKIIAGTALFGVAAGFMETYASEPGMLAMPSFPATLIILFLFCIAALQIIDTGGFDEEEGAAVPSDRETRLDSIYRLAIFVMMIGFLFVPMLGSFGVTGESIVLAGYLGLSCVLMCLFLLVSRIHIQDAAQSFAYGFAALYLGEMTGILVGNVLEFLQLSESMPYAATACAGLAALFAYQFLFTERDFRDLTTIVGEVDRMDAACKQITEEYGLSKREAEILPLVLKGRSGERIGAELYISKSTVDTHLRRIYAKTGTHGRQELIDLGERTMQELAQKR